MQDSTKAAPIATEIAEIFLYGEPEPKARFNAIMQAVRDHVAAEKAEAWDEGYRAGWSDRTKSLMEARTYEQEVALATRNPYEAGESA